MKHHTDEVRAILKAKGFQFVRVNKTNDGVWYITPKNQLVLLGDADLVTINLFCN